MNCIFTIQEKTSNILTWCGNELVDDELDYVTGFTYCPFCGQKINFQGERFNEKIEEHKT